MFSMSKKRILIIGGTGYIGKHLISRMAQSFEVHAPPRSILNLATPESYFSHAGVFDFIINLAGTISYDFPKDSANLLEGNVTNLARLLSCISKAGQAPRFLHVSSMTVYSANEKVVAHENDLSSPSNFYGLSKKLGEDIIQYFSETNIISAAVFRLPGIYGGDRKAGLIYNVREKARINSLITLDTTGMPIWETMHVDDLTTAILAFIEQYDWKSKFEKFNCGYGKRLDVLDTVKFIVSTMGSKSEISIKHREDRPFFMSSDKLDSVIGHRDNFESSLEKYLKG